MRFGQKFVKMKFSLKIKFEKTRGSIVLTDSQIKVEAALSGSYTRGCQYYSDGHVGVIEYDSKLNLFKAQVNGQHLYNVNIKFDDKNRIDKYECNCPEADSYYGACKHVVAVLRAIQNRWDEYYSKESSLKSSDQAKAASGTRATNGNNGTKTFLDYFSNNDKYLNELIKPEFTRLIATYNYSTTTGSRRSWLEFAVGNDKLYVMKDVRKFLESIIDGQKIDYGKQFVFNPLKTVFDDKSKKLLKLLKTAYIDEQQLSDWDNQKIYHNLFSEPPINTTTFDGKKFKLTNSNLITFFRNIGDDNFNISVNGKPSISTKIISGRPNFELNVKDANTVLRVTVDRKISAYYILDVNFKYIYNKGIIYKVDDMFSDYIKPIINGFAENHKPEILIPHTEISKFISTAVPALEKIGIVNIDSQISSKYYRQRLEKRVYFDRYKHGVSARIEFKYGEIIVNPADKISEAGISTDGRILIRDTSEENKVVRVINRYGFKPTSSIFVQTDDDEVYNLLKDGLHELTEVCEVFYSEDFKNIKIKSSGRISAGVRINTKSDILEMSLQYDDIDTKELISLLAAYRLKKKYYKMKNGTFISLDSQEFRKASNLIDQLGISQGDVKDKIIELPKYRALYVDSITKEMDEIDEILIERNSTFKKMVQDIREPHQLEYEVPKGINGVLRDYQKTGLNWLKSLSYYGLGGILADDMGLGKTLQIITLILSEKRVDSMPSLVIAPTSLLYNWKEEVQKFAPELKVKLISGQQGERLEQLKEMCDSEMDIVVTSYGMIKRDIQVYEKMKFEYCFIDEAQHIKNPNTLNARAVKRIKAKGYFALTGTPIENTLSELWSIFDFIMPGYLHTHHKFTNQFEVPIVRHGDQKALNDLGMHIKPFILRRMKKDVLKELPKKIESKMSNEMTVDQAKVYAAYMMQAKREFEDEMNTKGFQKSHIKILSLLTRLRQICCHPSLFIDNYTGGSGKLDMLMEILEDAIGGGHRILLFSQFTSMLSIIKDKLSSTNMTYYYLDGSTKSEDRIKLVNSFNSGEKDIFLISLKAGGTGINLTGADMVIHYDPWWNPAVEDQATDRAYRIGQKNSVQVFKLITKDTLEEKIYELQQKKKALIDNVIKPGESFLTKMTEGDIRTLFDF